MFNSRLGGQPIIVIRIHGTFPGDPLLWSHNQLMLESVVARIAERQTRGITGRCLRRPFERSSLLPRAEQRVPRGFGSCNSRWMRDDAGSALGKVPSKRSQLKSLGISRQDVSTFTASYERGGGMEEAHSLRCDTTRLSLCLSREGVSAGCSVGRCCLVRDVNADWDTSRGFGSAFDARRDAVKRRAE